MAHAWIDTLDGNHASGEGRDCVTVLFYCHKSNKDNCFELLDRLVEKLLQLLARGDSTKSTNVDNVLKILDILKGVFTVDISILRSWFLTEQGHRMVKPLLSWLVGYGITNPVANSLLMFRALQSAVELLQKMLYLNPVLQDKFCVVLYETLVEFKTPWMSGYLKYIIHQLVLVDEVLYFTFDFEQEGQVTNTHQIQVKLTTSIRSLVGNIKNFRTALFAPVPVQIVSEDKKQPPTTSTSSTTLSTSSTKGSYASNPLLFTGNMALMKRRPQVNEAAKAKPPTRRTAFNDSITVNFFTRAISDNVIPHDVKICQILQALYERGELTRNPTLLYDMVSVTQEKPPVFVEKLDWTTQKPMLSVFQRFADIGGLALLLPAHSSSNHGNHISLLSKIISLPGYSQVFLKDVLKAQLLLRSVMGVKETKQGRK